MSKFISFLITLALLVTLVPASLAHTYSRSSGKALKIVSAEVETDRQRVVGEVKVCNNKAEPIRFVLDVKNETINSLYRRKLFIPSAGCHTYKLDFTKNFAEMSNTGDSIRFLAKSSRGLVSFGKFDLSHPYVAVVKEGNTDPAGCGDERGGDGIYDSCLGDFIYHTPTGLRIKINSIDYRRADLLVTHIRWGGVKKIRIYKNHGKKVVAGNDDHTKVEMSNLLGEKSNDFLLKLESI